MIIKSGRAKTPNFSSGLRLETRVRLLCNHVDASTLLLFALAAVCRCCFAACLPFSVEYGQFRGKSACLLVLLVSLQPHQELPMGYMRNEMKTCSRQWRQGKEMLTHTWRSKNGRKQIMDPWSWCLSVLVRRFPSMLCAAFALCPLHAALSLFLSLAAGFERVLHRCSLLLRIEKQNNCAALLSTLRHATCTKFRYAVTYSILYRINNETSWSRHVVIVCTVWYNIKKIVICESMLTRDTRIHADSQRQIKWSINITDRMHCKRAFEKTYFPILLFTYIVITLKWN